MGESAVRSLLAVSTIGRRAVRTSARAHSGLHRCEFTTAAVVAAEAWGPAGLHFQPQVGGPSSRRSTRTSAALAREPRMFRLLAPAGTGQRGSAPTTLDRFWAGTGTGSLLAGAREYGRLVRTSTPTIRVLGQSARTSSAHASRRPAPCGAVEVHHTSRTWSRVPRRASGCVTEAYRTTSRRRRAVVGEAARPLHLRDRHPGAAGLEGAVRHDQRVRRRRRQREVTATSAAALRAARRR